MKPAFATLVAALATSAAAAPLEACPEGLECIGMPPPTWLGRTSVDKRVAPVAAGIFGVAAGSIANAVITGATKGATSGSVRGTINKIFGPSKRSVPAEEEGWTFDDVRELFAKSAVEDLIADEATPEEAAVCVSVAYEVGGDDSLVREATSVLLNSTTDAQTAK